MRPPLHGFIRASACAVSLMTLSGCDRIRSAVGRGDGGGGTSAAEAASLAFLGSFEGDIGVLMKGRPAGKGPNDTVNTDLLVKNAKLRFDLPKQAGPQAQANPLAEGYVVVHTPDKKLYFVMDPQKQAIVIDLNKAGQQIKTVSSPHTPSAHAEPPPPPPKVVKTGRKNTVAGYTCEDWEITSQDNSKGVVCVAQEGPSWFSLPITGIPTEHLWAAELLDGKHFPLRFIGYDKAGTEEGRIEVTHIDKKPLADSLFEIPPGYKVVDIEQMFQGFGPGAGGPGGPFGPGHAGPGRRH